MKYVSLQPPTLLSRDGALLKKQMVDVFPALDGVFSSGLFVGPPPTGRRDELSFKLEFFTHSSDPTLLCHY